MKYKLIKPIGIDIVSTVLENRNISNVNDLINPPKVEYDPIILKNLEKGVNLFIEYINKLDSKIGILVDCDVDGYTSATLFYNYLSHFGIRPRVFIHNTKKHGLTDKEVFDVIVKSNINLLIIPDAASADFKEHKILDDLGIKVLILDHHECSKYSNHAIVINNQMCDYPNKDLSGAGVTYKFLAQTDKQLNKDIASTLLDLVALGNIADMMDMTSKETRYYVFEGLKNINNKLFKKYLKKNEIEVPTIIEVAFKVAPEINSIIRMATKEEKTKLFNALVGLDYSVPYKPRGKEETLVHITDDVVRISASLRNKQRNAVKKAIKESQEDIEKCKDKNILIIKLKADTPYTITGLIANQLAKENKKCCIVLRDSEDNKNICTGSARTYMDMNFKDMCSSINKFNFCDGHQGAFGVSINSNLVDEVMEILHKKLEGTSSEKDYEVDYIIDAKDLRKSDVEGIAKLKYVWGGGIPEPIFVIKNIILESNAIKSLARSTVGFTHNNIQYIKTFAPSGFLDDISCKQYVKFKPISIQLNIICKFMDSKYGPQVHIIDFESSPYVEALW